MARKNRQDVERQKSTKKEFRVLLEPEVWEMMQECKKRRGINYSSEYLKYMIRMDGAGMLLTVDKAFENLAGYLATGFGSAVGLLAAEMERDQVERSLKKKGGGA